jgi:hypothetical protein
LAVAQGAAPVSFESLLLDPTSQLDAGAAVLRSILQYASAPKATAGPPPVEHRHSWPDEHVFSGGAPSFRFGFDAASGSPQRVSA